MPSLKAGHKLIFVEQLISSLYIPLYYLRSFLASSFNVDLFSKFSSDKISNFSSPLIFAFLINLKANTSLVISSLCFQSFLYFHSKLDKYSFIDCPAFLSNLSKSSYSSKLSTKSSFPKSLSKNLRRIVKPSLVFKSSNGISLKLSL